MPRSRSYAARDCPLAPTPGRPRGGTLPDSDAFPSWTPAREQSPSHRHLTQRRNSNRQFVCLSDRDEYAELVAERGPVSAWFINPDSGVDATAPETFQLLHFAINGNGRPIRRSARKAAQTYTATIGADHVAAGKPVNFTYTYRAPMAQTGHLLFFDIEQPTRDLQVSSDYQDCDIASVSTLDMIPSIRSTRVETPVDTKTPGIIRVALDGWVFPRSGIAFVWTLRSELPARGQGRPSNIPGSTVSTRTESFAR